jgi:glycosyltransferase involved in cell wall biosynthesis
VTHRLVLYAPNVHVGGGHVLLCGLLAAWRPGTPLMLFLDARARERTPVPDGADVRWVKASAFDRLAAERALHSYSREGDTVLCFHGLPPILPNAARVVVFQQNRNYLGLTPLSRFAPRTAVRLGFERLIARLFRRSVDEYIVQTPTMARDFARWYGSEPSYVSSPSIRVLPFVDALPGTREADHVEWDFVYVSDGEAHKNHRRLLDAWMLLAQQGLRPRLALTLGPRDHDLIGIAEALRAAGHAEVHNLGSLSRPDIFSLYRRARALIFPSTSESFGLPLIEASHLGVPIVASETDFVRDVCEPVQTFDPASAVSIARAVRRFLQQPEPVLRIGEPQELWSALLAGQT